MADLPRILVVDDEPTSRALVRGALGDPFVVDEATNGAEALAAVATQPPDLIVCDYSMPEMDGVELVRQLRQDVLYQGIPIIMLTAHDNEDSEVSGFEAGADDYVVKPFRAREFRTRVMAQIRRRERDLSADPFTRLPSGGAISDAIRQRIEAGSDFAAIYADLDHFKPFVDHYGFLRAGQVVQETARLFQASLRGVAGEEAFAGHIAGDDFLGVCAAEQAAEVCRGFIQDFDRAAPGFYPEEDAKRGFFEGRNRAGQSQRFPLISVSLCVVDSRRHPLAAPADVSRLAFSARAQAKALPGSGFVQA